MADDKSRDPLELAKANLAGSIEHVACTLTGAKPTSRAGGNWRFGGKGSLSVVVAGPRRGSWYDHQAGTGGDALGLVAHLRRCSMREALAWAQSWLGTSSDRAKPPQAGLASAGPREAGVSETMEMARRLWREGEPGAGSPVAIYLASRGLALPTEAPLRFHATCSRGRERWPAMLALMSDPKTGKPCGVHRTFLTRDFMGKAPGQAKMMAGRAGVIRLVPDTEIGSGLGIAEGIETSIAVMQGFGWSPIWATASAGGIARFPVIPGVEALTIFADADDGGVSREAATACATRWGEAGRETAICIAPAGDDFLDVMQRSRS